MPRRPAVRELLGSAEGWSRCCTSTVWVQVTTMSRLLAAIAVSLFALACISSDADLKRQQNCGPALSDDQILKAAQRWLSVASPGQSIQDLHPSIKASGCQSVVIWATALNGARQSLVE